MVWKTLTSVLKLPNGHAALRRRRNNVDTTTWRCIDVDATLYEHHVPAGQLFAFVYFFTEMLTCLIMWM